MAHDDHKYTTPRKFHRYACHFWESLQMSSFAKRQTHQGCLEASPSEEIQTVALSDTNPCLLRSFVLLRDVIALHSEEGWSGKQVHLSGFMRSNSIRSFGSVMAVAAAALVAAPSKKQEQAGLSSVNNLPHCVPVLALSDCVFDAKLRNAES